MEDGSLADNPVNDIGTEQTTSMMISIPEALTAKGWAKVTYITGLKIHQGRNKYLKKGQQGTGIDSYFLRSKLSQMSEVQQ